jgi:hypothetical protein
MLSRKKIIFAIISLFVITSFFSCTEKEPNRYVVLSTGGNEGRFSVFLDTKTREVFSIHSPGGYIQEIEKKSIDSVEKSSNSPVPNVVEQ